MPTYMERKVLTTRELKLFHNVQKMTVKLLENPDETCHTVCKQISTLLSKYFIQVSGYFGGTHEHSWLRFIEHTDSNIPNGHLRDRFVIDPYPVATDGGAIIVDLGERLIIKTPWNQLYEESSLGPILRVASDDPLLNGTQGCGFCGVKGNITYEPGDGYTCNTCHKSD